MAINTATIQHRRGSLEDFNPEKMVPGELAFTIDGSRKVFAAFAPGDFKELASTEEVREITEGFEQNLQGKIADAVNQIEDKTQESLDRISDLEDKANVIEVEKYGETIIATDSSNAKFRGMNVYGKSTQFTTTGANLVNPELCENNKWQNFTESNTTISASGDFWIIRNMPVKPSTTYSTSFSIGNGGCYYDESGKAINTVFPMGSSTFIFTTPSNAYYVTLNIRKEVIPFGGDVMINEGSTALPWEPYTGGKPSPNPEYPQEVENCENTEVSVYGKNLLENIEVTQTLNGVTFTVNDDKSITLNGTATTGFSLRISGGYDNTEPVFSYKAGENYAISTKVSNIGLSLYSRQTGSWENVAPNATKIFTPTTDGYITDVLTYISEGAVFNNVTIYPQIEVGTVATEYEPYKVKQSLTIPYTLCGIEVFYKSLANYTDENGQMWACDYVDAENGVYVQNVGTIVLDGSEASGWRYYDTDDMWNGTFEHRSEDYKNLKFDNSNVLGMCNQLKMYPRSTANIKDLTNAIIFAGSGTCFSMVRPDGINNLDEWKAHLQENPIVIVHALATPVETPLTAEQIEAFKALHSNYPNTTVMSNNNAGMMVKYGADTKLYIDNKFAELAAQLV